jgi:hypothetical protein
MEKRPLLRKRAQWRIGCSPCIDCSCSLCRGRRVRPLDRPRLKPFSKNFDIVKYVFPFVVTEHPTKFVRKRNDSPAAASRKGSNVVDDSQPRFAVLAKPHSIAQFCSDDRYARVRAHLALKARLHDVAAADRPMRGGRGRRE